MAFRSTSSLCLAAVLGSCSSSPSTTETSGTDDAATSSGGDSESESNETDSGDATTSTTSTTNDDSGGFAQTGFDGESTDTGPVDSHDDDMQPIWAMNCLIYCHGGEEPKEELTLEWGVAYGALIDVPSVQVPQMRLVVPGSLEDSYLWHKIKGSHRGVGGSGELMPLNADPLSDETIARIEEWILIGAPE